MLEILLAYLIVLVFYLEIFNKILDKMAIYFLKINRTDENDKHAYNIVKELKEEYNSKFLIFFGALSLLFFPFANGQIQYKIDSMLEKGE
jgi:hypothetical protein